VVTIAVPDLDQAVAEIEDRGLSKPTIQTIEGAGRRAPVVDPEGNTVTLIEVLAPNE
jgi:predicted enzyme related to lactoylglutathione lyase